MSHKESRGDCVKSIFITLQNYFSYIFFYIHIPLRLLYVSYFLKQITEKIKTENFSLDIRMTKWDLSPTVLFSKA